MPKYKDTGFIKRPGKPIPGKPRPVIGVISGNKNIDPGIIKKSNSTPLAASAKIAKTPDDAKMNSKLKNIKAAEAAFQKLLNSGKVKDIQKARQQIYNKYGVWPNGSTN